MVPKRLYKPITTNANRLPDSHRMDVAATYNFKHGSIGLSIYNLYGRQNVWYKNSKPLPTAIPTKSICL
jgi:hypothetical protein